MRMTFIGGPGVGKTTLAQRLADHLGLTLLPEQSRPIAREWGLTPATVPPHRFMEFQWEILYRQMANEDCYHNDGFIADRCVIDTIAHLFALGKDLNIDPAESLRFIREAARRLPHYDMVVYIPPMFPIVSDGERIADQAFQAELSGTIQGLIDLLDGQVPGLKARTHFMQSLPVNERIEEVLQIMPTYQRMPVAI